MHWKRLRRRSGLSLPTLQSLALGDLFLEGLDTSLDRASVRRVGRALEKETIGFGSLFQLAQRLVDPPEVVLKNRVRIQRVRLVQKRLRLLHLARSVVLLAALEQIQGTTLVVRLSGEGRPGQRQRDEHHQDRTTPTSRHSRCESQGHLISSADAVYFEPSVRSIGRYQVAGRLATGGMGEILLAQLRGPGGFERAVVIKRILPHLAENAESVRMFLDEARIAAGIRHDNVIQVQELIHDEHDLCIVMEYLEGESLSGLMRRLQSRGRSLPASLCCHVVAEVAAGLHAAHELRDADGNPGGLVHRDVSPQNTFITYDGSVKVLDFGIAYFHDRRTRTATGTLRGKFEYMSPEQCLSKPLDRRSDVFALGVVLYELTTGRRLYRRRNQLLTLRAIVEDPVLPPSRFVADYPEALEPIVMRALAKDPAERYDTAAALRRDLVGVAQALSPGELSDEALASLMAELFHERREEKRSMLSRLRAGAAIGRVPDAEVDEEVELPTLDEVNPSVVTQDGSLDPDGGKTRAARSKRAGAVVAWGGAALLLAVAAGTVVWLKRPAPVPGPSAMVARPPPSPSAPAPSSVAPTSVVAPAAVTLRVESAPEQAVVSIDGKSHGQTPVDVRVRKGSQPVRLELRLDGYRPLVEEVVPDVDQRLRLVLQPRRGARPPAKPRSSGSGYRRFD